MEALAALSLACNILQLIEVSLKATKALRTIREEHAPDASIHSNTTTLRHLGREVSQSIERQGIPQNDTLLRSAEDIVKISMDLDSLINRFIIGKKSKLKDTFAYIRLRSDIKAKEKRLWETHHAFQSTVLIDLRQNVITQWATVAAQLPSMTNELRTFTLELRGGNSTISSLIQKIDATLQEELSVIKGRTQMLLADSEQVKSTLMSVESRETESRENSKEEVAREQFISSLHFPSMNARRNMSSITAAEGTFEWICRALFGHTTEENIDKTKNMLDRVDKKAEVNGTSSMDHLTQHRVSVASILSLWAANGGQQILWVSGKAGSGKSTLMNFLTRSLLRPRIDAKHNGSRRLVLSGFIWSAGDELQKSVKGLLCTLLHQLYSHQDDLVKQAMRMEATLARKMSPSDWDEQQLQNCLRKALENIGCPIYIFIDGLDEIQTSDSEQLVSLVFHLGNMRQVKVCVSSRPEPIFERTLQQYPHLRLQEVTRPDMMLYVKLELEHLLSLMPASGIPLQNADAVLRYLVDSADGVFLWVQLVIRSLKHGIANGDSWELLWERLREIPDDLEALYTSMLQRRDRVTKVYRHTASKLFALMLADDHFQVESQVAKVSLNMNSLASVMLYFQPDLRQMCIDVEDPRAALTTELARHALETCEQIQAHCAGLLELPKKYELVDSKKSGEFALGCLDDRITFIHRTARDFMLDQGRNIWRQSIPCLKTCFDVQHASARLQGLSITPVELWARPSAGDLDCFLLHWWTFTSKASQNERLQLLQHVTQTMIDKSYWDRHTRNPGVVSLFVGCYDMFPPHWWTSWTPTGMAQADYLDHLLFLSTLHYAWLHENPTVLHRLYKDGADPLRRDFHSLPGSNWPSALTLVMGWSAQNFEYCHTDLTPMMSKPCIDFKTKVTVLLVLDDENTDGVALGFALNQHVASVELFGNGILGTWRGKDRPCFILRMNIAHLLLLALSGTNTDTPMIKQITELAVQLDNIANLPIDFLGCVEFSNCGWPQQITGGFRFECQFNIQPTTSSLVALKRSWNSIFTDFDILISQSAENDSIKKMGQPEMIAWLLDSGFAEDKRDQYWALRRTRDYR